jgi:uncharacterized protein
MEQFYDNVDARRLVKAGTFAVTLLAIFLLAETLGALKNWSAPSTAYDTIVVSGQGEAFATPDIATFTASVSADAPAVADAQANVTKKMDAIIAALKDMGVDENDIQTTDYSIYPKYMYVNSVCTNGFCPPSRQIPNGYTVTHGITVKIRKTDDAGKALGVVGQNGATNVSGLSFTVDDPNMVQGEARDKAVKDAQTKAKALAKSLGVSLGRVVSFDDSASGAPMPIYAMDSVASGGAFKAVAPSIPAGQNKVTDNVNITYEIR